MGDVRGYCLGRSSVAVVGVATSGTKEKRIQPLPDATLRFREEMSITVNGRLNGRMTELRLNEFDVLALGDEK